MINRIFIDNYKSLVNFEVEFEKLNIILGKNGCGKSSVFEVISSVRNLILGKGNVSDFFKFSTLTKWQKSNVQSFEIDVSNTKNRYSYRFEIEHNAIEKKCKVKTEVLLCDGKTIFSNELGKAVLYSDSFKKGPQILADWNYTGVSAVMERRDNRLLTEFKNLIAKIIVCSPVPSMMEEKSERENSVPDFHFSNIVSVYRKQMQSHPECLLELWNNVENLSRTFVEGDEDNKKLLFEYNSRKDPYLLSELSDGERMLFALYFLVCFYSLEDSVLLIDEPDNYLSLTEIQPWLQTVEDKFDEKGQCIVISHHPEVIDYFASPYGIWLQRSNGGATRLVSEPNKEDVFKYSEMIKLNLGEDENEPSEF